MRDKAKDIHVKMRFNKRYLIPIFFTLLITILFVLKLVSIKSVPKKIIKETQMRSVSVLNKTVSYKIVYPKNMDKNKKYDVVLGLSGGGASK